MARKSYYVTRDMKNPLRYPTRMLTAGQEIGLSDSAADLFRKVGVELSNEAPKRAAKVEAPVEQPAPQPVAEVEAPKPAAKKAAPKRTTRRKK